MGVLAVSGVSIFALGSTFNYLVALFHKEPVRQGLFGKPIFDPPLDRQFGWMGLLAALVGLIAGAVCLGFGFAGWPVSRLWLYLLGAVGAGLFALIALHPSPGDLSFVQVIPYTLVAGLFLSNFPEALSSSANMLGAGWSRRRIFLMWFALMVTISVGAALGFLLSGVLDENWLAFAEGLAAGAMLTMIAAAMIPEAAAHGSPNEVGLSTLAGFLTAVMFKLLE